MKKQKKFSKKDYSNARARKAWKNKRLKLIENAFCFQCHCSNSSKNPLTIHHTTKEAYLPENFHLYETLSEKLPYIILCKKCHSAIHHGLLLCPKCLKNYRSHQYPTCYKCSSIKDKSYLDLSLIDEYLDWLNDNGPNSLARRESGNRGDKEQ